ncbi:MAG TPA: COX15/CtaA family protein, partial [Chitinophagaceae bacterium]
AALFLAIIPVTILHKLSNDKIIHDKTLRTMTVIALMVLLVQIIIGTGVREQVDEVSKSLNYQQRDLWLPHLNAVFEAHKVFSIITSLLVIAVFWRGLSHAVLQPKALLLLLIVLMLMAAGITLASFNIPAFIQPIHLLLSSILFVALFAFRLNLKK